MKRPANRKFSSNVIAVSATQRLNPSAGTGHVRTAGNYLLLIVFVTIAIALFESSLAAATKNWDFGAGTYAWNAAANWDTDGVPIAGDTIQFYGIGAPVPSGQTISSITTYGNNTATSIDFKNGAGFILSGAFGAGNTSYLANVNVSDAFAYTMNRTSGNWGVSSTYGLKANIITGGSLTYGNAPIGSGNNPYPILKDGDGLLTLGVVNGTNTTPNAITLNGGTLVLTVTGNVNTTGVISGNGAELTKAGNAIYTLSGSGANTFSGLVNVTAGTLALNKTGVNAIAGSLGINGGTVSLSASDQISDTSNVSLSSGTFALGANSDTVGGLTMTGGSITGTGTLTSATNFNLQAGTVAPVLGGAVALNKSTAGTVTLNGANTYSGGTTISGGTLVMGTASALGSGNLHLSGGKLNANGFALAMGITGNGTLGSTGGPITVSGLVSPGNSPGTITFDANTLFTGNYEWELATYSHTSGGGVYPVGTPGLGGDWDLFQVDGAIFTIDPTAVLTLNNSSLAPDSDSFWTESHLWTIIDTINGGSIVNLFDDVNLPSGNGFGTFSTANIGGTELQLLWTPTATTPVPEPGSTLILIVVLGVGLVSGEIFRRRRVEKV